MAKTKTDQMLEKYQASLTGRPKNVNLYVGYAHKFLEYAGPRELDRAAVLDYIEHLRRQGYSDGTVNFWFRIIQRFFLANGLDWPFRRGEAPRVRESEVYAPALHPQLIRQMIGAAVEGKLDPGEAAFLALSTTYGARKAELMEMAMEDIDIDGGLILIRTVKKGRQRWHVLPKEIQPYLKDYDFPPLTEYKAQTVYLSTEAKAGLTHEDDVGYHSIRRTLVTLVGRYCQEMVVHNFFRWGARTMAQRYFATTFVGLKEKVVEIPGSDREVDDEVFAQHPFLPAWRGE